MPASNVFTCGRLYKVLPGPISDVWLLPLVVNTSGPRPGNLVTVIKF